MAVTPRVLTFALACTLAGVTARAQDDDLDVLLDRLATYLEQYEAELSTLVADERYLQEERRRFPQRRITESEVLFLRLPGYAEWFGVRDTQKVDGKEVKGSGITIGELMKNPGADIIERAAQIVEASSRHNLGGRRTINMPTVPLEALSARNHPRYIFKVRGSSRIHGVRVRKLEFTEFDEPTLVQASDGGSLWSRGAAWIDPVSGALWRAELIVSPDAPGRLRRPDLESRIRVDFIHDQTLDLLVPTELTEYFWVRGGVGYGNGKYTNFRKFSTSARLIPKP
jgi:hypothetical protein